MHASKYSNGFTLLELLIALAVAAILAAMAAPSLKYSVTKSAVESVQKDYLRGLNYARGEAVARNKIVSICPSADGFQCDTSNSDWSKGWIIFIDNDRTGYGNGVLNTGEELLRVYDNATSATVSISNPELADNTADVAYLSWNLRGFIEQRVEFTFCSSDNDNLYTRGVSVEPSGRTSLSRDQNNDGFHDSVSSGNTNLRCG